MLAAKELLEKLRGSIPLLVKAGKSTRKMAWGRRRSAIWVAIIGLIIIAILSLYILKNYRTWVGGGIILLALILFGFPILTRLLDKMVDKKLKEEKRAIWGARSEEKIGEILAELSEDFLVLHDIESPYGNIDHIVISKRNGIFLIETKSHGGQVTVEEGNLLVNGRSPEKDFITQVVNNTYWLKQEISELIGPTPWITPILVFTNAFVVAPKPIKNVKVINKKYLINTLNKLGEKNIANDQIWEQRGKVAQKLVGKD